MAFRILRNTFRFTDGVAGHRKREYYLGDIQPRGSFFKSLLFGPRRSGRRVVAATGALGLDWPLPERAQGNRNREQGKTEQHDKALHVGTSPHGHELYGHELS